MKPGSTKAQDDSTLDTAMDFALGYAAFAPSASTYTEIKQTGASRLFGDKGLVRSMIELYERGYAQIREWDDINRRFVLDRIFPFVDEHGPTSAVQTKDSIATGYHSVFRALEEE